MESKNRKIAVPYAYLVDNIKVFLIFLVVFNHLIAFQLVKVSIGIRHIWYAITIFHMPAFIFVSGYLSKKPQSVIKNIKSLLIPYILGYTLTWYSQVWIGKSMDYQLLRPSGTAMWYLLALFIYRLTIEALSKVRFIVPLSIIFALWAGLRPEFTTYLSTSRIVVFFPFFVAGYLWKSEYTKAIRKFKGKWIFPIVVFFLLFAVPNYMINHIIPVDIFRGNHSYLLSGVQNEIGMAIRLLMYLISFIVIFSLYAILPDRKLPTTYMGRKTMGIYFFHYPVMIVMNGLKILELPQLLSVWSLLGMSVVFMLVLGNVLIDFLYNLVLKFLTAVIFKREKQIVDEGLEEEYDDDEEKYHIMIRRKKAIEDLAATLQMEPIGQESDIADIPDMPNAETPPELELMELPEMPEEDGLDWLPQRTEVLTENEDLPEWDIDENLEQK